MQQITKKIQKLPQQPGVYQFLTNNTPIYIGKANNLKKRVQSYFVKGVKLGPKTASLLAKANKFDYIPVESEIEALLLEAALIKKYQPKYNTVLKDDKSHLYIKITIGDEVPQITTARREKVRKGVKLFGPFPSASTVRSVLRIIRHIFPYVTSQHGGKVKRKCLYCHLGLCPFPWQSEEAKIEYRKTVRNIILFLQRRKGRLITNLEKEMRSASNNLEFEKAGKIKKQITDLEYITTTVRAPEEYLARPDLLEDISQEKLLQLADSLNLKVTLKRIECYDVSNIFGKYATGSLVVFENGVPAKNWYRKFKVRAGAKPDDVSMMREVLERRFKNDWPLPDLLVVDGGRGQLNVVSKVFGKLKINIPYAALAKRLEEIYLPGQKNPVRLKKDSPALHLIQAIRDEAHRFAITYHRKLRAKGFLTD